MAEHPSEYPASIVVMVVRLLKELFGQFFLRGYSVNIATINLNMPAIEIIDISPSLCRDYGAMHVVWIVLLGRESLLEYSADIDCLITALRLLVKSDSRCECSIVPSGAEFLAPRAFHASCAVVSQVAFPDIFGPEIFEFVWVDVMSDSYHWSSYLLFIPRCPATIRLHTKNGVEQLPNVIKAYHSLLSHRSVLRQWRLDTLLPMG